MPQFQTRTCMPRPPESLGYRSSLPLVLADAHARLGCILLRAVARLANPAGFRCLSPSSSRAPGHKAAEHGTCRTNHVRPIAFSRVLFTFSGFLQHCVGRFEALLPPICTLRACAFCAMSSEVKPRCAYLHVGKCTLLFYVFIVFLRGLGWLGGWVHSALCSVPHQPSLTRFSTARIQMRSAQRLKT